MGNKKVEAHRNICEELNIVYEAKNHDYGDSFAKVRSEFPNSVLIRIADKFERLKQLMNGAKPLVKESIEDSFLDMANYCIMEVIERRLESEKKLTMGCKPTIREQPKDGGFDNGGFVL